MCAKFRHNGRLKQTQFPITRACSVDTFFRCYSSW